MALPNLSSAFRTSVHDSDPVPLTRTQEDREKCNMNIEAKEHTATHPGLPGFCDVNTCCNKQNIHIGLMTLECVQGSASRPGQVQYELRSLIHTLPYDPTCRQSQHFYLLHLLQMKVSLARCVCPMVTWEIRKALSRIIFLLGWSLYFMMMMVEFGKL